jgi:hypothetical protein
MRAVVPHRQHLPDKWDATERVPTVLFLVVLLRRPSARGSTTDFTEGTDGLHNQQELGSEGAPGPVHVTGTKNGRTYVVSFAPSGSGTAISIMGKK